MLRVSGRNIVDEAGQPVTLRGCGLGGWMNMENFITGYPGTEGQLREGLRKILGEARSERFLELLLSNFFERDDATFLKSAGLNSLRIPINYRHLENDAEPFKIKEEGFRHLDRVIDICSSEGIYTIVDLHALPGFQNQGWHSDNPTHRAFLWDHPHFQDRVINLWQRIAERYCSNPLVAGYDVVNEPADSGGEHILPFYERLYKAIRQVDPHHIVFLEGNRYATDFSGFPDPWPGVVYSIHDYSPAGFVDAGLYPGVSRGEYIDRSVIRSTFERRAELMLSRDLPIWVGEFGPVYSGDPTTDEMRYQVLRDQLEMYETAGVHWAIWTYKDIGLQGLQVVSPDSPWIALLSPVLEKKTRLGVDAWGGLDNAIRHVMQPLEDTMRSEFPNFHPYPYGQDWLVKRLVRNILFSEALVEEWCSYFDGIDDDELARLASSFRFSECRARDKLVGMLRECAR